MHRYSGLQIHRGNGKLMKKRPFLTGKNGRIIVSWFCVRQGSSRIASIVMNETTNKGGKYASFLLRNCLYELLLSFCPWNGQYQVSDNHILLSHWDSGLDLISSKPFRISTFGKYKPFKNYTGLLSDRLESDIRISSKELTPSTLLMSLRRFLGWICPEVSDFIALCDCSTVVAQ